MSIKKEESSPIEDYESDQNLLGFFQLLLKVDMRIDPEFYRKLSEEQKKERKQ